MIIIICVWLWLLCTRSRTLLFNQFHYIVIGSLHLININFAKRSSFNLQRFGLNIFLVMENNLSTGPLDAGVCKYRHASFDKTGYWWRLSLQNERGSSSSWIVPPDKYLLTSDMRPSLHSLADIATFSCINSNSFDFFSWWWILWFLWCRSRFFTWITKISTPFKNDVFHFCSLHLLCTILISISDPGQQLF